MESWIKVQKARKPLFSNDSPEAKRKPVIAATGSIFTKQEVKRQVPVARRITVKRRANGEAKPAPTNKKRVIPTVKSPRKKPTLSFASPKTSVKPAEPKSPPKPSPKVVVPPPPPVEYVQTLTMDDYALTLDDLVFHQCAPQLEKFIKNATKSESAPKLCIVKGNHGAGKTFVVERTCRRLGLDTVYIDGLELETHRVMKNGVATYPVDHAALKKSVFSMITSTTTPETMFEAPKKRVIVVELLDTLDATLASIIIGVIQNTLFPTLGRKKTEIKRQSLKYCTNPVIITCRDDSKANIFTFVNKTKLKSTGCIFYVNVPHAGYRLKLLNRCAAYAKITLTENMKNLASQSDDIRWMLNAIYMMSLGVGDMSSDILSKDEQSVNIFGAGKAALLVEGKNRSYDDAYEKVWRQGGDRMYPAVYNSYLDYVPVFSDTKDEDVGDIADAFSLLDMYEYSGTDVSEAFKRNLRQSVFKCNANQMHYGKQPNINVKMNVAGARYSREPLRRVFVLGESQIQTLRYASLISNVQQEACAKDDSKVVDVQVGDHVGMIEQMGDDGTLYREDLIPDLRNAKKGTFNPLVTACEILSHKFKI